ncbi:hypothetical protein CGERO_01060 [Corynebacterium gerontici]|uniref:Uncharacterized protein n=1 Tax=Corynebacterium gerontici TaxID=2079234 RepID=A0A3G6IY21_9CORY|nr:hypothetical protein CGERO_01060 [Corynebacterium gerontici]
MADGIDLLQPQRSAVTAAAGWIVARSEGPSKSSPQRFEKVDLNINVTEDKFQGTKPVALQFHTYH